MKLKLRKRAEVKTSDYTYQIFDNVYEVEEVFGGDFLAFFDENGCLIAYIPKNRVVIIERYKEGEN